MKHLRVPFFVLAACGIVALLHFRGNQRPAIGGSPCVYCAVPKQTTTAQMPPASVVSPAMTSPEVAKSVDTDTPLAAFADWSARYLKAPAVERDRLVPEGIKLAEARRPVLKEMIKDNPREALENAVPMVVRQQLPASILFWLEQRVNQRGNVTVYQGVPQPGETLPQGKSLTHRIAELGTKGSFNLYPAGPIKREIKPDEPDPNLINRVNAALNGISIDREFAANDSPLRVLEVGELPDQSKQQVNVCPVSGLKTASEDDVSKPVTEAQAEAVVETPEEVIHLCGGYHKAVVEQQLIYAEGSTGGPTVLTGVLPAPPTPAIGMLKVLYIPMRFQDQATSNNLPSESKCYEIMRNVADYYSKSSFGKLTTLTTVTPPIVLSKNEAWYVQRDTSNGGDVDGLGLEMADARAEARRLGFDYQDYDVTVLRLIGGARATGGWGGGGNVWVYGDGVGVCAHEIGHTFGLAHANYWDTAGTSAIGPGANQEYGDQYDVMGGGGVPTDQYNAAAKVQVKWLPQSYVQNITTSGLYRLHAFDQQVLDPRNKYALTVTKDSNHTYWGELRQQYTGSTSRPWVDKGMILGWKYASNGGSNIQLIDTTPGSPYAKDDAPIALGQTFADTAAGIYMTTVNVSSTTPKYVDVLVNIGDFSSNHAPALTLAASTNVIPVNGTVTFTATASDADGDTLAYQWQHWGDTSVKLVNPNSPTMTRTFSSNGTYVVSCTVSDMKGGSVTRWVLITAGSGNNTFTISGRVTNGGVGLPNVLLTANGINPTITDADGCYTIANLAANTYSVTPALYGYTFSELFNNSITVGPSFTGADFDTDVLPSVSITAVDASATENSADTGTYRLTRTGDTSLDLVVNVNPNVGTATLTTDYTFSPALASGSGGFSTWTIPAGSSTRDVTLTTVNEATQEGPETVIYSLAAGSGYLIQPNAGSATIVIDDDDTTLPKASVAATTDNADEGTGSPGVFTFSRTGDPTSALTVNYTVTGTATSGADYTALSGSVSIPGGSASATVNVTPINDSLVEPMETIIATISASAGNYVINPSATTATVSLFDDDTNVVSVVATDATAQEVDLGVPGNKPDTGTFFIKRTGDTTNPLTVYYSVAGNPGTGTPALNGVDYEALAGVVTIPSGATSATVTVIPRWDGIGEGAEQVLFQLGAGPTDYRLDPTNNAATVTINDGAGNAPYVEVQATAIAIEGGSSGTFVFSLKGSQTTPATVEVPFALTGTATLTGDYTVTLPTSPAGSTFDTATGTGKIIMTANVTTGSATANTVTLTIVPVNDAAVEDIETVVCTIGTSTAITTFPPTAGAQMWLRDNDAPTIWVDSQVNTGGSVVSRIVEDASTSPFKFYVSRTGSTAAALTVNFSLNGTAVPGEDYQVNTSAVVTFDNATGAGTVTIPAASSGASVTLGWPVTPGDTIVEGTETVICHLEAGTYSRTPDAKIYIDDNDTSGGTSVAFATPNAAEGSENVTDVSIPVTLSAAAVAPITVDYAVDSGARSSVTSAGVIALPYWVRVVRTGPSFASYYSTDGSIWVQRGTSQTMAMSSTSYTAGIAVASSVNGTAVTATVDNLTVTGLDAVGTQGTQASVSIGTVTPAASNSVASGVYTISAGGPDIQTSGTSGDNFRYIYYPVSNSANCTITARVVSMTGGVAASKVGVMIREAATNTARHASMVATQSSSAYQIYRLATAGSAASSNSTVVIRPWWVKLKRTADAFSAWSSSDGSVWAQMGSTQTIAMGLDVQAGLAVSARSDGALATAVFDSVTINGSPASGLKGRTVGYVQAQGSDVIAAGAGLSGSDKYTVTGSGAQIGGTEDECHFVGATLTGDFELVARVVSQTNATATQAGVMARETNSYRSLSAYVGLNATSSSEFIYRNSTVTSAFGDGVDFSLPAGTLSFAAGEQTKNITLTVINDTIPEPNEAVSIKLLSPTGAYLGTATTFTYVIDDDDSLPPTPFVGFALSTSSGVEAAAGTQQIAVTLSQPATGTETVDYAVSGTAISGTDYTLSNGTVSFAAGESVKYIPLTLFDDSTVESARTVILTLSNPVNAALNTQTTHTFTINDDDLPVVSIVATTPNAAESPVTNGVFTVSRTGPTTSALSVTLARTGTATTTSDFTNIATPLTLTIPIGATSATLNVVPVNDTANEASETVIETISTNAAYTIGSPGSATVTIADDDRPTVTISATDAIASEAPGNTGTFTITRTGATTSALSVALTISGTASNTTDYATLSTPVSIPVGSSSATITITPVNDLISEGDETVVISLASGSYVIGGTGFAQVTIQDNDYAPIIGITSPTASGALVASGQGIVVSATATDDGSPVALTTTWTQTSGPGTATFSAPGALTSSVTFSEDGVYVLKFTATDTQFTVSDQVTVIVGTTVAPMGWIAEDMTPTTQQRGQSGRIGSSYILTGMGAGYTGTTDGAHVVTNQVTGDGSIVARITSLGGAASSPTAGVTIRDSLNKGSMRAVLGFNAGTLQFRSRTAVSTADTTTTVNSITLPVWVKLERLSSANASTPNLITASYSSDGSNWTAIGTSTVVMQNDLTQMGLTATGNSTTASQVCTATFDNVTLTPAPGGQALITEDLSVSPATAPTFSVSGGTYSIGAVGGLDASGAFYGWQYNGDLMITARLASATSSALSAHSGLMIRESMDSNAGYVFLGRCPTGSFNGYFWRSVASGTTGGVPSFTGTVRWMRLIREGNKITAFHAADSGGTPGTWTQLGSPRTIIMSSNVLVGLAVDNSGGTAGVLNNCTFTSLSIVPMNKAPTISIASVTSPVVSSVNLTGTVTDDNYPVPVSLTKQWSVVSSPGISILNPLNLSTSAAITGDGTHSIRLSADDSSVQTFKDISFTGYVSSFSQWQSNTFTDSSDPSAAPDADPDKDGLCNLLEYATGTSGAVGNASPITNSVVPVSSDQYLSITVPKNPAVTDVSYVVEATSDLSNPASWSSAGLVTMVNTSGTLQVRDNVPLTGGNRRFMRVRVWRS